MSDIEQASRTSAFESGVGGAPLFSKRGFLRPLNVRRGLSFPAKGSRKGHGASDKTHETLSNEAGVS